MIGKTLGSYQVVAKLGEGGMGEVYRARDTRLNRDVALKTLPSAFTGDAERLARFEREAQALAALNHPNIAAIYGIEGGGPGSTAGEAPALVMELVEGEDLSARIARGPIPLDEALPIARQVAAALEAAHDAGIVHRDLKPGNIKVRSDGTVKVLDFGLAKALDQSAGTAARGTAARSTTRGARSTEHPARGTSTEHGAPSTEHESLTVLSPAFTQLGMILGTAAYMAPEQAKGRVVDRRADVWAFGVVLYEMLTGKRAFAGEDVTEVIAAVIRDTPPQDALPAGTPPAVRRLLRRCLEKDPRKRLRDMGDAGVELDDAIAGSTADEPRVSAVPASGRSSRSLLPFAAGAVALAAVAAVAGWLLKPEADVDRPLARFLVVLPEGQEFISYTSANLTISRDGRRIGYRTSNGIFVRNLDELEPRLVAKAPGSGVWFSPGGESLLYFTTTGLSKVAVAGGTSQEVLQSGQFAGAHWYDDGTIVASTGRAIVRVPADGGPPTTLVDNASSSGLVAWPQLLPEGRLLLYTRVAPDAAPDTVVRSLDDGRDDVVLPGVGGARYLTTGHLLYGQEDRLFVVPFDPATGSVTGSPVPMPETVYVSPQSTWPQAAVSDSGTLVYLATGSAQAQSELVWTDAEGAVSPAHAVPRVYSDLRLSSDGRRVALHLWDEENDVWVADLVRGGLTRITFTPTEEETPVWSPDGLELAYAATRTGELRGLFRRAADGSAAAVERKVWEYAQHFHVNDWSPDGRTILVEARESRTSNDILAVDVETGKAAPLLASSFAEGQARFSPDGKWLAYTSTESGRTEVYVQPYPALDRRVAVSTAGGTEPVWSHDGRRLYFRSPTEIMVAAVTSTSSLEFAVPHGLFADRYVRTQGDMHTHFDVAPDGRLLFVENPRAADRRAPLLINVVLNWTGTFARGAPAR